MNRGQSTSAYRSMMVISRKNTLVSELQAELAIFFMEHHFYLKELTHYGYLDLGIKQTFS